MIEPRYQTFLARVGAGIVDSILFVPIAAVGVFYPFPSTGLAAAWEVFDTFAFLSYSVLMHGFFGRTVGKWVAGVIVLDASEKKRLTLRQAFLRDLVPIALTVLILAFELLGPVSGLAWLNWIAMFWFLAEVVTMLFNDRRRAVHDFIAGSVVVHHTGKPEAALK